MKRKRTYPRHLHQNNMSSWVKFILETCTGIICLGKVKEINFIQQKYPKYYFK